MLRVARRVAGASRSTAPRRSLPRRCRLSAVIAIACLGVASATTAVGATPSPRTSPLPGLQAVAGDVTAGTTLEDASAQVNAQLSGDDYAWIPQSSCLTTAIRSNDATPCVLGDTTAASTIVLYGDSSADQWALDLDTLGTEHHFRVVVYVHAACPVGSLTVKLYGQGVDPTCAAFRALVLKDLEAMHPSPALVVVSELRLANYVTAKGKVVTDAAWSKALTTTLETIEKKDGDAVAVLHGVPVTRTDPGQCVAAHPSAMSQCLTKRSAADPGGYDAATWSGAHHADAAGVNVVPLFCTTTLCPVVAANDLTHAGDNHVTEAYAAVAGEALGELLGCATDQAYAHSSRAAVIKVDLLGAHPSAGLVRACRALAR